MTLQEREFVRFLLVVEHACKTLSRMSINIDKKKIIYKAAALLDPVTQRYPTACMATHGGQCAAYCPTGCLGVPNHVMRIDATTLLGLIENYFTKVYLPLKIAKYPQDISPTNHYEDMGLTPEEIKIVAQRLLEELAGEG